MAQLEETKQQELASYIADHPDATTAEVRDACGVSTSTAYKWIKKIRDGAPKRKKRRAAEEGEVTDLGTIDPDAVDGGGASDELDALRVRERELLDHIADLSMEGTRLRRALAAREA